MSPNAKAVLDDALRVAAVDSGNVETVPWADVRDRLFARLGERRAFGEAEHGQ